MAPFKTEFSGTRNRRPPLQKQKPDRRPLDENARMPTYHLRMVAFPPHRLRIMLSEFVSGLVTAAPLNANHRAALPLGEFQRQVGIWWNQPTARPKSSWNGLWTRNRHSFKSPLRAPHMLSGEFKSRLV